MKKQITVAVPRMKKRGLMGRKPTLALKPQAHQEKGSVVQLVRMLPCHGRGRGFVPSGPHLRDYSHQNPLW